MTAEELKPSIELLDAIRIIQQKYGESKDLVYNAYKLAIRDGFSPIQARDFLFAQLPFLSESTIRKALPAEAKDQNKVRVNFATNLSQNKPKSESNTVNITTKATIQDADLVKKDPPPEDKPLTQQEEIEWRDLRIKQLEDALHKTEQFKPASKLTEEQARDMTMEAVKQAGLAVPLPNEESIFDWIKKRDNGVTCYWYDGYGIELFKTRVLSQLKAKGVTTFKRLYFEV